MVPGNNANKILCINCYLKQNDKEYSEEITLE